MLTRQLREVLDEAALNDERECEQSLRVAAATLCKASPRGAITSTTVVGAVDTDEVDALSEMVSAIADEYGLQATVDVNSAGFVVRFLVR